MWSCFVCHWASVMPSSAVTTISGLLPRLVRDDASCIDSSASARYSVTKLRMCLAVEALASASAWARGGRLLDVDWAIRRPTPTWPTADTRPATRVMASEDRGLAGGPGLGAVE